MFPDVVSNVFPVTESKFGGEFERGEHCENISASPSRLRGFVQLQRTTHEQHQRDQGGRRRSKDSEGENFEDVGCCSRSVRDSHLHQCKELYESLIANPERNLNTSLGGQKRTDRDQCRAQKHGRTTS